MMAVRPVPIIPPKNAEAAQTTQYTAVNATVSIVKMTVTNETDGALIFSAHIVPTGQSATNSNRHLSLRAIAPNETYLCPEIVGHSLAPGWSISTLASATGLTIACTGNEIT